MRTLPRTIHTPDYHPEILRRLVHLARRCPYLRGSLYGTRGFSDESLSRRVVLRDGTRIINERNRLYGGGRTRILIFALAMFRVRPGVNWMLIAVDSWPYIRGTLSPSPPGGPSGPGPQVVYPHVTPLCSATTTTVPPSRATTTPLWDRRPTLPLPYGYASREETLLSFFNERVSFFSSFARVPVRCLTSFFFLLSSHIFADTLAAL